MHNRRYSYLFPVTLLASSCLLASCDKAQGPSMNEKPKAETAHTNIITLPSGLKYEVLKAGAPDAKQPTKGQLVTVHYTGWLDDHGKQGKKFDSSVDRGEKFTFKIGMGQVIKGWDEGVLRMKIGAKHLLIIPADLGYGAYGAGNVIPGGATLRFEVELFEIR